MENNIYKTEYVKHLFNSMSSSYERVNYLTSFGFSLRWRRQFLKPFAQVAEQVEIIDLMTSMGETWHPIKRKFPNSKMTVLDFSEGMLKNAKQKNTMHFNGEVNILQQDILNNSFQNNYYDFVTCAFGLKTFNAKQLRKLALETKRILKNGGQFSFIEVSKLDNRILNSLYAFYIGRIVPILGKVLLGNPEEYKMLWKYTAKFENSKRATEIFKEVGLNVKFKSYFFGCATGFIGIKEN